MRSGIYIMDETLYVVGVHFAHTPVEINSGELNLVVLGNLSDNHEQTVITGHKVDVNSNVFRSSTRPAKRRPWFMNWKWF